MNSEARDLRTRVEGLKRDLENAQQNLKSYVRSCDHDFEKVYDPIYHEAHTYSGDPPGTMGVDWRGPVHVPAETIKRWRRTCNTCGEVQYTQRVHKKTIVDETPDFGDRVGGRR